MCFISFDSSSNRLVCSISFYSSFSSSSLKSSQPSMLLSLETSSSSSKAIESSEMLALDLSQESILEKRLMETGD